MNAIKNNRQNLPVNQCLGTKLDILIEIAKLVVIVIILGKTAILPINSKFHAKTLFCCYLCSLKFTRKKPIFL